MEKIIVGKAVNVSGLKGEIKVYNYSDSSEIYENTESVYLGDELYDIERVRLQKNMVILKLKGIDDRNAAEEVRGREVFVTEADLPELPEGQYYVRELIGMSVREDGSLLGRVTDVIQNTAQDIFEVELESGRKVLIPKVDSFILNIDAEKREITVSLIDGLLDLQ